MTTKRRKVYFETFWIGRASQIVREEIKVLFPVVPLEQFRFLSPLLPASQPTDQGEESVVHLGVVAWSTVSQLPMYIFGGWEKAITLSQKGCEKAKTLSQKESEKAKLCIKMSVYRKNFAK